MKFRRKTINTKEVLDIALAALVVKETPNVMRIIAPGKTFQGLTPAVIGGAVTYALGMLFKKPLMKSAGLAITASEIAHQVVVLPALKLVAPEEIKGQLQRNAGRLSAYTASPRNSKNYAFAYQN